MGMGEVQPAQLRLGGHVHWVIFLPPLSAQKFEEMGKCMCPRVDTETMETLVTVTAEVAHVRWKQGGTAPWETLPLHLSALTLAGIAR
jgi:hypothetical protein